MRRDLKVRLKKDTPAQLIEIKQPRWRDRVVLIAKYKVGTHNIIDMVNIKEGNAYSGKFYLSGATITKYPLDSNGKIPCYAVPLDELQVFEGRE